MAKPVILKSIQFPTKVSALDFFKAILDSYFPGDKVSEDHSIFLSELLERHLEFKTKLGCGIDHFVVMRGEYDTKCFGFVRTDNSQDNFSYIHCVTQLPR